MESNTRPLLRIQIGSSLLPVCGIVIALLLGLQAISVYTLFLKTGQEMAEVPELTSMLKERALENEIIFTVATANFESVLLNLICSMERNNVSHYIIGALDQSVFDSLQAKGFPVLPAFSWNSLATRGFQPGFSKSREFNRVNIAKQLGVIRILELGYNVVLTDADVVWRKNPLPYLRRRSQLFDFVFQTSEESSLGRELNGGFFYAKASPNTIRTLKWLIYQKLKDPLLMDQPPLRLMLCAGPKRLTNSTCHDPIYGAKSLLLPLNLFQKGDKLLAELKMHDSVLERMDPFIVHYTGGKFDGAKKEQMTDSGLWFINEKQECSM